MARGLVVRGVVTKTTAAGWLTSQPAPRLYLPQLVHGYSSRHSTSRHVQLSRLLPGITPPPQSYPPPAPHQSSQVRRFAMHRRARTSHFQPLPIVAYGVRTSKTFRLSKESMRRAAVHARRQEERTGFLLDTKKCLQMELKRNTGIGWTRSLKILKHLECHVRTKGPPCNQAFREKVAKIAWQLKQQGPTRP